METDGVKKTSCAGYDDCTEFTIKVTMRNRWIPHFLAMLKEMQYLGAVGSSREIALFSDGDGDFRPKFEWPESLDCNVLPVRNQDGHKLYDAG